MIIVLVVVIVVKNPTFLPPSQLTDTCPSESGIRNPPPWPTIPSSGHGPAVHPAPYLSRGRRRACSDRPPSRAASAAAAAAACAPRTGCGPGSSRCTRGCAALSRDPLGSPPGGAQQQAPRIRGMRPLRPCGPGPRPRAAGASARASRSRWR